MTIKGKRRYAIMLLWFAVNLLQAEKDMYFRSESLFGNITINQHQGWNRATLIQKHLHEGSNIEDQQILIQKEISENSPLLALHASSSDVLPEWELVVIDPQNPKAPFFRVKLTDVQVKQSRIAHTDQKQHKEFITLRFRRASWHYTHFLMWGDEVGLEYWGAWDYDKGKGELVGPEEGDIPAGAYKYFREGFQIERVDKPADALQLSWPAQKNAAYDIYATDDLNDNFETHIKTVNTTEDGLTNAIVELEEGKDRMFYIVRLKLVP